MTHLAQIEFTETSAEGLAELPGCLALILGETGALPKGLPRPAIAAIKRARGSEAFAALAEGDALAMAFPAALTAETLVLVKLSPRADRQEARRAGAAIARHFKGKPGMVLAGKHARSDEIALGLALRSYNFDAYKKTGDADSGGKKKAKDEDSTPAIVQLSCDDPRAAARKARDAMAVAEGVFFTRDLISEPANVLTTSDFADRIQSMEALGLEVEILDEKALKKLGMRALLAVGQGSESPSKVAVMRWNGGAEGDAPLALVGKGVVFDTGGISIKPAAGMEEMTMDMGGAGVVAGVMRTLALRKAKANVVGLVGLVENMPDGRAQRPGDIVRSMKGDSIEVINTDAEGRLVLADLLWYAQERFAPAALIDLATLTGAVIVALGHDHAGIFGNDDTLADALLKAAAHEGEGAWRLPLAPSYDKLIDSRLADMKNSGGRAAGSITAAQFLQRFVKEDQPWLHIDIAGVALLPKATDLAPRGATGWGVMTLDRLIRTEYETRGKA